MKKEPRLEKKIYAKYSLLSVFCCTAMVLLAVIAVCSEIFSNSLISWLTKNGYYTLKQVTWIALICSDTVFIISRTADESAVIKERCTYEVTARLSRTKTQVKVMRGDEENPRVEYV